jgi:hypothetical protein
VIVLGVVLLIIGLLTKISLIWTIGIVVLVIGLVLAVAGMVGHGIGGRRHWF